MPAVCVFDVRSILMLSRYILYCLLFTLISVDRFDAFGFRKISAVPTGFDK